MGIIPKKLYLSRILLFGSVFPHLNRGQSRSPCLGRDRVNLLAYVVMICCVKWTQFEHYLLNYNENKNEEAYKLGNGRSKSE